MLPGSEEPAPSLAAPQHRDIATVPFAQLHAQLRCSGVPMGPRQPCCPVAGPTLSPTARAGRPLQPRSSGLWKPAAAASEQLAPGREGPPGGAGPGVPAVGNQGRRAGVGAGPDWDRLGYRGPFVWGFMACEAALPARQEAPIGTRLARGAPGRGQEEGEGGDSTALLWLQHHCGLMAVPQPPQTPRPALCHPGCSVAGLAPSLDGGCCWVWPCPRVPAATPNTSISQGEDTQRDISHPAAWLWWA